jgi:hypothetical protein
MKPETRDRRYFDETLHGWAHTGCDLARPKTAEERFFEYAFGVDYRQRSREDVATSELAATHGHVITKERENTVHLGTPSRLKRVVCSCGFMSPWSVQEKLATDAKRAHLKDAAIYG